MKSKQWPPPEEHKWAPSDVEALLGQEATPIGQEEWFWLGPDPKRSDGQQNL